MQNMLFLSLLMTATLSFASDDLQKRETLSALEETLIELFTPYAKQRGLTEIAFYQDFDNTLYTGGVNVVDGTIRIIFGSEFDNVYPNLAPDAYAEVICHELGHILGDTAYEKQAAGQRFSPEAASDYFAGAVCLQKLFKVFPEQQPLLPDPVVIENCRNHYQEINEQKICQRVALAGFSFFTAFHHGLAKLVPQIKHDKFYALPDFNKKDKGFYDFYPSLQCRTETIANAALCKSSERLWSNGEKDWHCSSGAGARHACWYKY